MRLATYLTTFKKTDAEFAEKVGVDRSTVGRWAAGTVKPRWGQLPKIQEASDGHVTANDFIDEKDATSPPSEAAA